jgi:hypothetical protein
MTAGADDLFELLGLDRAPAEAAHHPASVNCF